MAKDYLVQEDTILLESDLIYSSSIIKEILDCPQNNIALVAKLKDWMNGTVVTINKDSTINDFIGKNDIKLGNYNLYYKTVNIYKFSKNFCKDFYIPYIEEYIKRNGLNSYYEIVLKDVIKDSKVKMFAYEVGDLLWYEIDDEKDLEVSNKLFNNNRVDENAQS